MPDAAEFDRSPEPDQLLNDSIEESIAAKLSRESQLISQGLMQGVSDRFDEMMDSPVTTFAQAAGAFAIGAGLESLRAAGGKYAGAARCAAIGLGVMTGFDLGLRLKESASAVTEVWNDPAQFEDGKVRIAGSLGKALLDYPLYASCAGLGADAVKYGAFYSKAIPQSLGSPSMFSRLGPETAPPLRLESFLIPPLVAGEQRKVISTSKPMMIPDLESQEIQMPKLLPRVSTR